VPPAASCRPRSAPRQTHDQAAISVQEAQLSGRMPSALQHEVGDAVSFRVSLGIGTFPINGRSSGSQSALAQAEPLAAWF
jgi:hypothetical protein